MVGGALLAWEAQRIQRNEQEAQRRRREEDKRVRRNRKYLTLRLLLGRAAAVAFIGSFVLEFIQTVGTDYERETGASLLLWLIALALFRQWRNAAADLGQVQERDGVFAVVARLRGDELSAGRRAEAYGCWSSCWWRDGRGPPASGHRWYGSYSRVRPTL